MNDRRGFTLVELLIALALSAVAMTAVYSAYLNQQKTYVVQSQVAAMQQNLRAAMFYMERELRMAGCDPSESADAGVFTADDSTIRFTMNITGGESDGKDNDDDGTIDESTESIYPDTDTLDTDEDVTYALADGDADGDVDLIRTDNGTPQMIAENIDTLNFVYQDSNSAVLATPVANLSDIRSVQVTVVARTGQVDGDYVNRTDYKNKQGTTILAAPNDNFRRVLLTTTIKCRNLGL